MRLSELASGFTINGEDKDISSLCRDSRAANTGCLFIALAGEKIDGAQFIQDALKNGAVAVLGKTGTVLPTGITSILVDEPRAALAKIAARFYPAQPKTIVAVTGTSGKTSTVQFTRQIWQRIGHKAASIGTLGIIGNGIERYGSLTTPDAISLHHDLSMLVNEKGITHLAMEASSHGLEQMRMDGVRLSAAAFTNLSRDHLDYHKDMETYLAAKLRLFKELLPSAGVAVLNRAIPEFENLAGVAKTRGIKTITFGGKGSDIELLSRKADVHGQELNLSVFGKKFSTRINLVGAFQAANVMCAAGLALASGESQDAVVTKLSSLEGVRGRMEFVGTHQGGAVYVDYAHKPDALENVLSALRPHTQGKLVVVVGCGGDRDAGKRPIMGAIAARLADKVIVTDDNPRSEDPALIRKAVMEGCPDADEIGDRATAIAHALSMLHEGDIAVIAGKGHEQGQIIGDKTIPFDDADVARTAMKGRAA